MVRTTKSRTIELKVAGPYLFIKSPPPGFPGSLQKSGSGIARSSEYGVVIRQAELLHFIEPESSPGSLCCFRGLEPLVTEWLERKGYEYKKCGGRISVLGEPDRERLAGAGIVDEAFLEFVRLHDRGTIRFEAGKVAPGHLIRQAALAFPDKKITVCVERIADIGNVERYLWGHVDFSIHASERFDPPKRVALATIWYATDRRLSHAHRDLVFFLDPRHISGDRFDSMLAVGDCGLARLFALVPSSIVFPPNDASMMTSVFGFEGLFIARHGYRPRHINVAMLPILGGPKLPQPCQPEVLKREGLWQHPVRNRRIAKLAKLLAAGDSEEIRANFPELPPKIVRQPKKRIVVVVENVEHAFQLARNLPGWDIVAGENCFLGDLAGEQITAFRSAANWRNRKRARFAIATHAGLAKVGGCDVLIRADGGTMPLPADLRLLRSREPNVRLAIVDFLDRHHPALLAWSKLRRSQYLEAGWEVLGYCPTLNPLEARWHHPRRPR